ncbi:MAG: hypothetical protein IJP92_09060 [Lachnospiraceae bacterium]|nr:hypothetical protein [Lachnospiraceae bacterium]
MELDILEKRLDDLEKKIAKAEAVISIVKDINLYELYFQGADCNGITKAVDWDAPGVSIEAGMGGKSVGARPNLEFFDQRPALARMPGALVQHESVTQLVEVADDLETAQVIDFCPGYKCLALGKSQVWSMGKYYHDMIRQKDGSYKIWHGHWFVVVEADAALGWLHQNRSYWKECMFSELDSIHNSNVTVPMVLTEYGDNYRADGYLYMYPEPPDPYSSFSESSDMKRTREY